MDALLRLAIIAQGLPKPTIDLSFPGAAELTTALSWLFGIGAIACLAGFILSAAKRGFAAATGSYGKRAEGSSGMGVALLSALALGAGWYLVTFALTTGQGVS